MKVAEIFADLGFKVQGADDLKSFEASLVNIANAARNAALALKILSRTPVPKGIATVATTKTPAAPGGTAAAVVVAPGAAAAPYGPPMPPPLLPTGAPAGVPNSVLQGLKNLGMLGLKVAGVATLAVAIKKLVGALVDMVHTSMGATYAVDKFTTQTGMSRRELKEWERVAELSDVKAEDLQETLKQLQQRSRSIKFSGEGMNGFYGLLGLNPHDNPTDFLKNFAQRTKGMDTATATYMGSQVGISESMVYMLRKNADKLGGMVRKGELGEDDQSAIMGLNTSWRDLMFTLGLLRDKIVAELAPAIKGVVDLISGLARLGTASKPLRDYFMHGGPLNPFGAAIPSMSGTRTNNTHVENNVQVDVNGADRPKETARATAEAIRRQYSNTFYMRPPPNVAQ